MRLALQRLLASPSALHVLKGAVHSDGAGFCQHCCHSTAAKGQRRRYTAKQKGQEQRLGTESKACRIINRPATARDDLLGREAIERNRHDTVAEAHARLLKGPNPRGDQEAGLVRPYFPPYFRPLLRRVAVTEQDVHSGNASPRTQLRLPSAERESNERWRNDLVTLEQYRYQSDIHGPATQEGPRLVDHPSYTQDWELWLELIVFRRRHEGAKGSVSIYKEIFRRELRLPTQGTVANQLWDLLIRAGFQSAGLLEEIVVYAIRLKRSTTRFWPGFYYGIVSIVLKKDPRSAYSWHVRLRKDFPPSIEDYQKLFKLSLDWGRSTYFRRLYKETPLIGMYKTIIRHLCELQMYAEAIKWHDVLFDAGDFPTKPTDIKPLLAHLIYSEDGPQFGKIMRQLAEAKVVASDLAETFVRMDTIVSREIMNRQIGEVHGVSPKHLSDGFCARLFATPLFSVDTIIKGLRMMAADAIGSLSLREIAVRDNCDPAAICRHLDGLKNAGISLESSVYCALLRSLAVENKQGVLKSVVHCDLHPDTFANPGLQERLLSQYYEENDLAKIERTFAVLTAGCPDKKLQMVRTNLILRCQITLGRREKVLGMLENMKHMGIPVSTRSSRHLRVCWLSRRQVGRGAETTQELSILIKASQMTMQSGRFVPIIAWREIMRRLGMAGRLKEVENLALWLVDWYSSPAAEAALPKRILLSCNGGQASIEGSASLVKSPDRHTRRVLNTLFTTSARHAIIAWGIQHFTRPRKRTEKIRFRKNSAAETPRRLQATSRFQWTWGLHLLYKLKKRGLPVQKTEIARICRHRINILFGTGFSKRKINRRARSGTVEAYTENMYIRKMEEIWGEGLFQMWRPMGRNVEKRIGRRRARQRLRRREEKGGARDGNW